MHQLAQALQVLNGKLERAGIFFGQNAAGASGQKLQQAESGVKRRAQIMGRYIGETLEVLVGADQIVFDPSSGQSRPR